MAFWRLGGKPSPDAESQGGEPAPVPPGAIGSDELKRHLWMSPPEEGGEAPAGAAEARRAARRQAQWAAHAGIKVPAGEPTPDVTKPAGGGGRAAAAAAAAAAAGKPAARRADVPPNAGLAAAFAQHNGANFLAPTDLAVTEVKLRRVALVGSCFLESLRLHKSNPTNTPVDVYAANNVAMLEAWPETEDGQPPYDFQVVQLGLRFVKHDALLWRLPYGDLKDYEAALKRVFRALEFQLERRMVWNASHGLLTFVCNFLPPQRNPMGALFRRYDLRNPEYFVEKINERLEQLVAEYRNAYILDMDRISASLGRRYNQDDVTAAIAHNSLTGLRGPVVDRIEPIAAMADHFAVRWHREFPGAVWNELIAMYRTVRQIDSVKMVVVDLDDTLWAGVIGEMSEVDGGITEGWHNGLVEALMYLKKRGILLAIISKNEEQHIRDLWPKLFHENLRLEDFAAVCINWRPKAENMREILAGVNLLPRNVVFIDDNPAERSAMIQAYPDLRVLGGHPYYLRQTLLWAPETQVVSVTEEAARRTEMVQAQLEREEDRRAYSADDFLKAAAPRVKLSVISDTSNARFARVQELVNKTNQFNTTGRRWAASEWSAFFNRGGVAHVFDVTDAYTSYGLVGVVLVEGDTIEQWVMSCRVLGYKIEQAVMVRLVAAMRHAGASAVHGRLIETDVNFPCRGLFRACGFTLDGDLWTLPGGTTVPAPEHVSFEDVIAR